MPLVGSEHWGRPHYIMDSPYQACQCGQPENARVHQPLWWRWLNPKKQYRV